MPWGAIAASVVGGMMASGGAGDAADAQAEAAEAAAKVEWDMYQQTRADQAPYRDVGNNALYLLADFYGLGYGGGDTTALSPTSSYGQPSGTYNYNYVPPTSGETRQILTPSSGYQTGFGESNQDFMGRTPTYDFNGNQIFNRDSVITQWALPGYLQGGYTPAPAAPVATGPVSEGNRQAEAWDKFFTSPDYDFRMKEGIRGIENSMLAQGKGLSGNTAKAITGYSGDLASGEWNNYANRLGSLAGVGQTATNQLGAYGAQAAGNIGNANIAAGQARGSGYIGQADAWGNALSGVSQAIGSANWDTPSTSYSPVSYDGLGYSQNMF